MTHVRQALKLLPVKLDLQTFYDWVESEEKLGKKAEDLISSLLSSSDEDIANKTSHIVVQISRKVGGAGTVDCTASQQVGLALQIVLQVSRKVGGAGTVDCTAG